MTSPVKERKKSVDEIRQEMTVVSVDMHTQRRWQQHVWQDNDDAGEHDVKKKKKKNEEQTKWGNDKSVKKLQLLTQSGWDWPK